MSKKNMQSAAPLKAFMEENNLDWNAAGKALGVSGSCVATWGARDSIPDYCARSIVLHSEVAKARQEAKDAREGVAGKRAVIVSGNALDVAAVEGMAERLGLDVLPLTDL